MFIMKEKHYLLGIIDIKIPCCETKSLIFFLHVPANIKGPIFPTFFPNNRRWERDCNIPSWAQSCFKTSFLALKNRTFQVKSKTTKIINKTGHYNSFFLFSSQHFKTQLRRVNETTTNQQDVVLKISQREIDYHTFNWWCNFPCFLFSL